MCGDFGYIHLGSLCRKGKRRKRLLVIFCIECMRQTADRVGREEQVHSNLNLSLNVSKIFYEVVGERLRERCWRLFEVVSLFSNFSRKNKAVGLLRCARTRSNAQELEQNERTDAAEGGQPPKTFSFTFLCRTTKVIFCRELVLLLHFSSRASTIFWQCIVDYGCVLSVRLFQHTTFRPTSLQLIGWWKFRPISLNFFLFHNDSQISSCHPTNLVEFPYCKSCMLRSKRFIFNIPST